MPARHVPWVWVASEAAWSTNVGPFPEVCKKSLQATAADMQGAIADSFWKTYSIGQLRKVHSASARTKWSTDHARATSVRTRLLRTDQLGRCLRGNRAATETSRRRRKPSGISAVGVQTKPASCCNYLPGCTAPTTSTTAVTIATRQAAWGCLAVSGQARQPSCLRTWNTADPGLPDRRKSSQ